VKGVEIPKPGGGVLKLGIPIVLDRFVQQAVLQVQQPGWDPTFSEGSYGSRPGRSAHQAVAQAQRYLRKGDSWVVDLDLEKFFDRVNQDKLMSLVKGRVADRRVLKLIDRYLKAGALTDEGLEATGEGMPQGGPWPGLPTSRPAPIRRSWHDRPDHTPCPPEAAWARRRVAQTTHAPRARRGWAADLGPACLNTACERLMDGRSRGFLRPDSCPVGAAACRAWQP
jgi:hypothetical protein